jgi:hypothetical protein
MRETYRQAALAHDEIMQKIKEQREEPLTDYLDTPFGKDQAEGIYRLDDSEAAQEPILFDFKETVKKLAEVQAQVTPFEPLKSDWRVTQLAREMCRTQGHDPDMMVVDVKNAARGPFGSVGAANTVPAWTLYLEAAGGLSGALTNG